LDPFHAKGPRCARSFRAPLYVHFDATESRSSNANANHFTDMLYEWDFGDPASGNWETSGLSRNEAFGGVGAHVYERPGTHTVTLKITDVDRPP
jgi:hypothetical protein